MEVLKFNEILVKKPFFEVSPTYTEKSMEVIDKRNFNMPVEDKVWYNVRTQQDFLREYFPSGHKINNKSIFPDVYKQDPETKRWYIQPITRCAIAMQQVIATKHIIHTIGNDVQFELSDFKITGKSNDEDNAMLSKFRKGWMDKSMEIRWFEFVRSVMITGDAAIIGFFKDGKFGTKTLSVLTDDILYPHYDDLTGELEIFARKYFDYDESGEATTEWVEVWDDTYFYRARKDAKKTNVVIDFIKDKFGLSGYNIVEKKRHCFNFIPVVYFRNDNGPCWSAAQDTIEKYEEAMSYFFENNKAFAFPILVVKGEGVELIGDDVTGAVKSISIDDAGGDAKFLEGNDVSASYKALLDYFYRLIYEQSFSTRPPELKSGDLPGVAIKLLFSPSIEIAMQNAQELQPALDDLVHMVKYGYGLEIGIQASLLALGINAWIEPYVHQNDTELTTNLTTAVQNKILSMQTGSERFSKYAKNDEYERIMREMKMKDDMDIRKEELTKKNDTDEEIRKQKALNGQDVNTGGGAGNERERHTDENGNWPGENNWNEWNERH